MTDARRKLLTSCLVGALLVVANIVVAVRHVGRGAGREYRWVCAATGVTLSYNPGTFGSARLRPGGIPAVRGYRWELVEPESLSPLLPWNWLALVADGPIPDPDVVLRQVHQRRS